MQKTKRKVQNPALITPNLLKWVRENLRQMSLEEASNRTKYSVEEIQAWENGTMDISIPQLKNFAHIYRTSIATFYLSEPPTLNRKKLADRRILPFGEQSFSPALLGLIDTLSDKQEWLSQNLKQQGKARISFGNFSTTSSLTAIVSDIKLKLQINIQEQIQTKDSREALRLWIERAESFGINVSSVSNKISLEEFRAFVLYDEYAPFICLNPKDSYAGRLFSLCHELAHLWLKQSVISNIHENTSEIEVLCNSIASQLLLDNIILHDLWKKRNHQLELREQVLTIARKFSVSEECIARYLLDCDDISQEQYQELRRLYNARWKYLQNKKGSGGPAYGLKMVLENGSYFTRHVLAQYHKGSILGAEASSLLGVKINHFNSLAEYLPPRINI